ncbi:YggT family protein [Brevibacillus dissolubilis]|uniref:YggT family protein n=1 Tax=Brevibacillus dissolubilis TaxID=1844116 RepID=UPI0011175DEE|nr:YggT family protein [Brevibacillus dissolubilis]
MIAASIYTVISFAFTIYRYMVIAYILMSWVPQMRDTPIGQLLERLVEPFLAPFRRIIPPLGMIDLSPIVAIFALYFAESGVAYLLRMLPF